MNFIEGRAAISITRLEKLFEQMTPARLRVKAGLNPLVIENELPYPLRYLKCLSRVETRDCPIRCLFSTLHLVINSLVGIHFELLEFMRLLISLQGLMSETFEVEDPPFV